MADGNVTVTTAANFIPELWRDAILDYAERKFQIKNQVSDFSSMLAGGGDILHIPKVTEETAAAKSAGSAVTYTNNTDGKIDLTVDQHHYEAKRIEDIGCPSSPAYKRQPSPLAVSKEAGFQSVLPDSDICFNGVNITPSIIATPGKILAVELVKYSPHHHQL